MSRRIGINQLQAEDDRKVGSWPVAALSRIDPSVRYAVQHPHPIADLRLCSAVVWSRPTADLKELLMEGVSILYMDAARIDRPQP